ncbi:MAG: hypothetical protein HPY62_03355 [Bacteroidales bacterium]|nr:hypothetical protein [Bacteroidales bacterium]
MIRVLGIKIIDRIKEIGLTQEVLSKYSSIITTRLGFHELTNEVCSREAYLILHLSDNETEIKKMINELKNIGGINIQEMVFDGKPFVNFRVEEGALRILGILAEKKNPEAIKTLQKTLTSYGCVIRTRLGVNEEFYGNPAGLIILELMGDEIQMDLLERDLHHIPGVHLRKMAF